MLEEKFSVNEQLSVLKKYNNYEIDPFCDKLKENNLYPLKSTGIDVFQLNIGKMCNQICKHCHVDAGPDRTEIMTRETMELALIALDKSGASTVDITGGAPEMNPDFYWFVEEITKRDVHVIVRSNLTILRTNKHKKAVEFFAKNKVEVVSSLPYYKDKLTDAQRGDGVFRKSIEALIELNKFGYGKSGSGLILNLVYNPVGAFLPPDQFGLEQDYERELGSEFGIEFNNLFCITNLPVSRYLDYLIASDNYEDYMDLLIDAFNPKAAENVMCRNTVSVSWDGYLYDCDFNQMLELKVASKSTHLKNWVTSEIENRSIVLQNHCYGCTAGSGSSCGGTIN